MADDDEEVLKYKNVVLQKSDLDLLNGPCYLNDRLIEFYFSYLSSAYQSNDILLVFPAISFWLANCQDSDSLKEFVEPLKLPDKKIVIFTVNDNDDVSLNDGGSHWSLLVYCRISNSFMHHDSLGGINHRCAMKLYKAIKGYVGSEAIGSKLTKSAAEPGEDPGFKECSTPQQTNSYDCGVYVLAIAKLICRWYMSVSEHKDELWFTYLNKLVDSTVELTLRSEVLKLTEVLKNENAQS